MSIVRVFLRRTHATTDDGLVFIGSTHIYDISEIGKAHINTTFMHGIPKAEQPAKEWGRLGVPVHVVIPHTTRSVMILCRIFIYRKVM